MMAKSRGATTPEAISSDTYARFVGQIELLRLWLKASEVQNLHGPDSPDEASIQIDTDAEWQPLERGFLAFQTYALTFQLDGDTLAQVRATFALEFLSEQPMTDELFQRFRLVNLPVNSWPFLREFVATTMGRMGWTALTLPTLKVSTRPSISQANETEKKPGRKRQSAKLAGPGTSRSQAHDRPARSKQQSG